MANKKSMPVAWNQPDGLNDMEYFMIKELKKKKKKSLEDNKDCSLNMFESVMWVWECDIRWHALARNMLQIAIA